MHGFCAVTGKSAGQKSQQANRLKHKSHSPNIGQYAAQRIPNYGPRALAYSQKQEMGGGEVFFRYGFQHKTDAGGSEQGKGQGLKQRRCDDQGEG